MEDKLDGGPQVPLWLLEPNEYQWVDEATGLSCELMRSELTYTWCGYVKLPPDHDWYGRGIQHLDVQVHGGLTFGGPRHEENECWIGFDCAHASDYRPGEDMMWEKMRATADPKMLRLLDDMNATKATLPVWLRENYRTLDYAKQETTELAQQVHAHVPGIPSFG